VSPGPAGSWAPEIELVSANPEVFSIEGQHLRGASFEVEVVD